MDRHQLFIPIISLTDCKGSLQSEPRAAILAIKPGVFNKLFYPAQIFLNNYLADMIFGMAVLRLSALLNVIIPIYTPLLSHLDAAALALFFKKING